MWQEGGQGAEGRVGERSKMGVMTMQMLASDCTVNPTTPTWWIDGNLPLRTARIAEARSQAGRTHPKEATCQYLASDSNHTSVFPTGQSLEQILRPCH